MEFRLDPEIQQQQEEEERKTYSSLHTYLHILLNISFGACTVYTVSMPVDMHSPPLTSGSVFMQYTVVVECYTVDTFSLNMWTILHCIE